MKTVCIIPARLASTRLPRKILSPLHGKILLQRVWEAALKCPQFSSVQFAVDSIETAKEIEQFGGSYIMTSIDCPSGTHRLIECIERGHIDGDIFVNWQADEPFITSQMIEDLLQGTKEGGSIWTLKKVIDRKEAERSDVVKVVTDLEEKALYFSRSLIPFDRDETLPTYHKHIGLYAYTKKALQKIGHLEQTPLSKSENLEQLLWLEHGIAIHVYTTNHSTLGIDTKEDLDKAIAYLQRKDSLQETNFASS